MAKQTVGIGSSANDGSGDTLRAGADKINDNFNEIYAALGNSSNVLTDIIDANGLFDVSSGANKIVFYYAALSDLPSCSSASPCFIDIVSKSSSNEVPVMLPPVE